MFISTHLTSFIDAQMTEIMRLDEDLKGVVHRLTSAEDYMATLYTTKFQTFRRPVQNVRVKAKKLSDKELPKWARVKRPWKQEELTFQQLDRVGQIDLPDRPGMTERASAFAAPERDRFL